MQQTEKDNVNWIFGLIFLILGIGLLIHSTTDFFKYNFTHVLFVFMRSNSSIIAEFIFGAILCLSGLQIFTGNKNWLNSIKILTLGVIVNLAFSFSLRAFEFTFDWQLILNLLIRILIGFGIFKLAKYLMGKNKSEWNIKMEKTNLFFGILIGLFPFIFRHIWF